jgi:hypothetical protein
MYKIDMADRNDTIKKAKDEERKRKDYEYKMFSRRRW